MKSMVLILLMQMAISCSSNASQEFRDFNGKSAYQLLGVKPTASDDEIKSAWQIRMKAIEPKTKGMGIDRAARIANDLSHAYEFLNPNSRASYDSWLKLTSSNSQANNLHASTPQPMLVDYNNSLDFFETTEATKTFVTIMAWIEEETKEHLKSALPTNNSLASIGYRSIEIYTRYLRKVKTQGEDVEYFILNYALKASRHRDYSNSTALAGALGGILYLKEIRAIQPIRSLKSHLQKLIQQTSDELQLDLLNEVKDYLEKPYDSSDKGCTYHL